MKVSIKKVIDFPIEAQMEILKWRNSKEVSQHFLIPHIEEETHKKWLESQTKDNPTSIAFFICDENNNRLGCTYITHIDYENLTCETGIFLDPETSLEGVGLVSGYLLNEFIFNKLKMYKINIRILSENKKVISSNRKFGFIEQGVLMEDIVKDGKRLNVVLMAMFAHRWKEKAPQVRELIKTYL